MLILATNNPPLLVSWVHSGTMYYYYGMYIYMWLSLGMLDEFGGLTKVAIYPACATLLCRAVVLAFPVLGQIDVGW